MVSSFERIVRPGAQTGGALRTRSASHGNTTRPNVRNSVRSAAMFVDAGGVHTYYEEEGSGEPLLLLHGGLVTIETWENQRAALAERFHVYLPERRGHGRTPDVPGPTGYDLMAADTAAFMQALGLELAHLVGWSDGGNVALELALAWPQLVRKLVLIGAAADVSGSTAESTEWVNSLSADDLPPFLTEPYARLSPTALITFALSRKRPSRCGRRSRATR